MVAAPPGHRHTHITFIITNGGRPVIALQEATAAVMTLLLLVPVVTSGGGGVAVHNSQLITRLRAAAGFPPITGIVVG